MPQLKLKTIWNHNETEEQVFARLRKLAEIEKERTISESNNIRIFDSTPVMQKDGNKVICQWKYKQYPRT